MRDLFQINSGTDIVLVDYDSNGVQTYVGNAAAGSASSDPVWKITKVSYGTFAGGSYPISYLFADGSPSYHAIWDNRGTLTYS